MEANIEKVKRLSDKRINEKKRRKGEENVTRETRREKGMRKKNDKQ